MTFDFDTVPDRRDTDSLKWARYQGTDIIPLWVADMDFRSPEPIVEALHRRVEHGVFGYARPSEELVQVVIERMARMYGWQVEPPWIVWLPGAVPALHLACRAFGEDGDEVLTFTPIYPPFLTAPPLSRKQLVTVPLRREKGLYTPDVEAFERALSPRSRVLLLCNPHNPVGRRYERQELQRVADLCIAHDIILCSDEIHCDLILDGGRHTPAATLGPEVADRTITLMAPSKTFNVPGLNCAFAVIPNEDLRAKFKRAREGIVPGTNALGFAACLAAYREGEPWRLALVDYLRANKDIVYRFVNEQIPGLAMDDVQATYLAWIDVTKLGLSHPKRFFEQAGVELFDGRHFGGPGHVRLNFGCPRALLLEALGRMKRAVMTLADSP
jgi:cystathionine beta-lyase